MKTSKFGQEISYYQKHNPAVWSTGLFDIVSKNGFKQFSPQGITSYFSFRYPIGDLTMFGGYKKVPFGYQFEDGKLIKNWYPKFTEQKIDFKTALEQTENLLIKAIKKLVQDEKLAVCLSGGVDSSLVVALLRKIYPSREIRTYSAGFYGDDEFEYSRLIAKIFNTIHQEKVLSKQDYIGKNSLLKPLIRFKAEPLHPNEIALANIEKMAKNDGCDIAFCGEGADDIFGGYGQNLRMYLHYLKTKNKDKQPFFAFFLDNYRYFTLQERNALVKEEYLKDDFALLNSFLDEQEMPQNIRNKVLYFTQKIHTPGLIIRGFNAIKFNGLKPGFPYIDNDLVEFVNSLPFDFKVIWKSEKHKMSSIRARFREVSEAMDIPKFILKKIAEKYLPEKIIYRKKYGFPVPFDKWFNDLKRWPLNREIFKTTDISWLNGWKKFMLINFNTFIEEFNQFKNL